MCDCGGDNSLRNVSVSELKAELKRRKFHADEAWKKYVARVYPTYGRDQWLTCANFSIALVGSSLLCTLLTAHIRLLAGDWAEPALVVLAALVFAVLFLPSIYFMRKERRLKAGFKKEQFEDAEARMLPWR